MLDINESEGSKCITIDADMTIYTASELKEKLSQSLDDPRNLEVNLNKVTDIDTAGVQLLMMAKKYRQSKKQSFTLTNHSKPVIDALETLGLTQYFGDPVYLSRKGE